MGKCNTGQGNRLCAMQVMLIEVTSWNLLRASRKEKAMVVRKASVNFQGGTIKPIKRT
jgi:hypothetical protein